MWDDTKNSYSLQQWYIISNVQMCLISILIISRHFCLQRRRRFSHATLRLRSAICRHHPPQRAVLSQICCFGERKVVLFQILLDGAAPRDAGTTWLSSPVYQRGG